MAKASPTSRRALLGALIALAAALLAAATWAVLEAGQADAAKTNVIGKVGGAGQKCSRRSCRVIASVTVYQAESGNKRGVMTAPRDGHIVAYGLDMGTPSKDDREALAKLFPKGGFDGKPTAQLAVLGKRSRGRLKLKRKSNDVNMARFYGEQPRIALKQPMRVSRGDVIGLTTPSWLPVLGGRPSDIWRASQDPKNPNDCGDAQFLREESRPQRKVGSTRRYRCGYKNRILYWAYFVAKRDGDGGGGGAGGNRATVIGEQPADLPSGGVQP